MKTSKPQGINSRYRCCEWNCQTKVPDCILVYMQTPVFHRKGRDPYISSGTSGRGRGGSLRRGSFKYFKYESKKYGQFGRIFCKHFLFGSSFAVLFWRFLLRCAACTFCSHCFSAHFFVFQFFVFPLSKNQNLYMFIGRVTYE